MAIGAGTDTFCISILPLLVSTSSPSEYSMYPRVMIVWTDFVAL